MLDGFLEDESLFGEFLRTPVSEGGTEPPVVGPPHVVGGVVPQLPDRGVVVPAHELLPQQPVRRREQLPTHHRDTAELLAYRYLPTDDPTAIRTLIVRKERQIGKLRDEVDRLKLILPEHDTGKPENRHTGMTEHRNTGTDGDRYTKNRNTKKPRPA